MTQGRMLPLLLTLHVLEAATIKAFTSHMSPTLQSSAALTWALVCFSRRAAFFCAAASFACVAACAAHSFSSSA